MKRIRNVLFAMLAVVMVLSMTACNKGKSGSGDSLVGVWGFDFDLSDIIAESIGSEYADFNAPLELSIRLEFKANGTYSLYGDEESFMANYADWMDQFIEFNMNMIYEQYEALGFDRADVDQEFEQSYGSSMEDYMRQLAEEEMDASVLFQQMTMSGKYETSGDKLYMSESEDEDVDKSNYEVFTITGNTLKLDLPEGVSAGGSVVEGLGYPIELKKVG